MNKIWFAIFTKTLIVICATVIALIILEYAVANFFPQFKVSQHGMYQYHPKRGYSLKKNFIYKKNNNYGYKYSFYTNRLGFRDNELAEDADVVILSVGDSHTFGDGVEQQYTYPSILEKNLNDLSNKKIDVINAGVAAYGWIEEYYLLEEFLKNYNSDLVILQVSWNDINDNGTGIPKYLIDKNGNLISYYDKKRPGGFGKWGMKTSQLSKYEVYLLKNSQLATLLIGYLNKLEYFVYKKEIDNKINKYKWEYSENILHNINMLLKSKAVPLFIIIHPAILPNVPLDHYNQINRRIEKMFKQFQIPYINIGNRPDYLRDPLSMHLENDEHFNKKGYYLISDVIEQFIVQSHPELLQ